jgi:hypothetical protein
VRHQIVVQVDEGTLRERAAGRSEFEHGPSMPTGTARRLSCDGRCVKPSENDQDEPFDVDRKAHSIPPALRRTLNSRGKGRVFRGCPHQRYVDGHPVHHWAEGDATKHSNLVSLCRFRRRQVPGGGIRIERLDDGAWRFIRPNGESIASCAPGHTNRWLQSGPISRPGVGRAAFTSTRTRPALTGAEARWATDSRSTCC